MSDRSRVPADPDLERAILTAVLEDERGEALALLGELGPLAFYSDQHRAVWRAVLLVAKAGHRPEYLAVRARLEAEGDMPGPGPAWLYGLGDGVPRLRSLAEAGSRLRELAAVRGLMRRLQDLHEQAREGEPLEAVREGLLAAVVEASAGESRAIVDAEQATREALDDLVAEVEGRVVGLPSGLPDLDALLRGGGWRPGQFVVIGARPSRGKTGLLLQLAEHAAQLGRRVLFFSLEMPPASIQARRLAAAARVDVQRIGRRGDPDERREAIAALRYHAQRLEGTAVLLAGQAARTVAAIRAEAFRVRAEGGLGLVVVDYLGLVEVRGAEAKLSLYERTSLVSKGLRAIAADLGVPLLTGVQLSRMPEASRDKRPGLAHFRDSGSIEQDADVAILIHQDGVQDAIRSGPCELILAKQRNGRTGSVPAHFDAPRTRFESAARPDQSAASTPVPEARI